MKKIIIPAILEKKFSRIKENIKKVKETNLNLVQIDICDGVLTPSKTMASNFRIDSLRKIKKLTQKIGIEIDLIADLKDERKLKKYI